MIRLRTTQQRAGLSRSTEGETLEHLIKRSGPVGVKLATLECEYNARGFIHPKFDDGEDAIGFVVREEG
jgi:hypothetical protein